MPPRRASRLRGSMYSFIEIASIDDVLDGLLARFVFTSGSAEERRPQVMTPALEDAWRRVIALGEALSGEPSGPARPSKQGSR